MDSNGYFPSNRNKVSKPNLQNQETVRRPIWYAVEISENTSSATSLTDSHTAYVSNSDKKHQILENHGKEKAVWYTLEVKNGTPTSVTFQRDFPPASVVNSENRCQRIDSRGPARPPWYTIDVSDRNRSYISSQTDSSSVPVAPLEKRCFDLECCEILRPNLYPEVRKITLPPSMSFQKNRPSPAGNMEKSYQTVENPEEARPIWYTPQPNFHPPGEVKDHSTSVRSQAGSPLASMTNMENGSQNLESRKTQRLLKYPNAKERAIPTTGTSPDFAPDAHLENWYQDHRYIEKEGPLWYVPTPAIRPPGEVMDRTLPTSSGIDGDLEDRYQDHEYPENKRPLWYAPTPLIRPSGEMMDRTLPNSSSARHDTHLKDWYRGHRYIGKEGPLWYVPTPAIRPSDEVMDRNLPTSSGLDANLENGYQSPEYHENQKPLWFLPDIHPFGKVKDRTLPKGCPGLGPCSAKCPGRAGESEPSNNFLQINVPETPADVKDIPWVSPERFDRVPPRQAGSAPVQTFEEKYNRLNLVEVLKEIWENKRKERAEEITSDTTDTEEGASSLASASAGISKKENKRQTRTRLEEVPSAQPRLWNSFFKTGYIPSRNITDQRDCLRRSQPVIRETSRLTNPQEGVTNRKKIFRPLQIDVRGIEKTNDVCYFCRTNGSKDYHHRLKEPVGNGQKVVCPVLRKYTCKICNATGDNAHTLTHCPLVVDRSNGEKPKAVVKLLSQNRKKTPFAKRK